MIVIDEYLALRALKSGGVAGLPTGDTFGLTYLRHWRLISSIARPQVGRLSAQLATCNPSIVRFIQRPDPAFLDVVNPVRLSLAAASYLTVLGPMSALFAETIAACIEYDSPLFIGEARNGTGPLADKCRQAGVEIINLS